MYHLLTCSSETLLSYTACLHAYNLPWNLPWTTRQFSIGYMLTEHGLYLLLVIVLLLLSICTALQIALINQHDDDDDRQLTMFHLIAYHSMHASLPCANGQMHHAVRQRQQV